MERSQAARMTHSYARILFVLGPPLTRTTTLGVQAPQARQHSVEWQCGCRSTGPFVSMVWTSCKTHVQYTSVLDEDMTATLVAARDEVGGMQFGENNATWSFDPSNLYHEKRLRDEYLSILHACGRPSGDFFAAEVIYRELISNALHHAPGKVSVELQWGDLYPVLNVHDRSALFSWTGELPCNSYSERGRGSYLVNSLARSLRIKDWAGRGYKIAAVLPVRRKSNLTGLFDFPELDIHTATGVAARR